MLRSTLVLAVTGGLLILTGCSQPAKKQQTRTPAVMSALAEGPESHQAIPHTIPAEPKPSLRAFADQVIKNAQAGADSSTVFLPQEMMSEIYISAYQGILSTNRQNNERGWKQLVAAIAGGELEVGSVSLTDPTVVRGAGFNSPVLFAQSLLIEYTASGTAGHIALENLVWTRDGWRAVSFKKEPK